MINLKDVTLVSLDNCGDYISKDNIRIASISRIIPWIISNVKFGDTLFINPFNKNSHLIDNEFKGINWYNNFVFKKIPYLIKTKYYLVIQYDGFPLNFNNWNDSFLEYDYIGGGDTLQNGGFSLRNTEQMIRIIESPDEIKVGNEDHHISHYLTNETYNTSFKLKSADKETANKFSYFLPITNINESFGWHRGPYVSERDIFDIFSSTKLFNHQECNLLAMYLMSKFVSSWLFNENYMEYFKMEYNNEFFNF